MNSTFYHQKKHFQFISLTHFSQPQSFHSQVLHVIDDILIPLTVNQGSNEIYNPDAYQFLVNANIFNINPHRVRNFYQRVVYHKSEKLYQADGYHTFFIPVEEGFKVKLILFLRVIK